MAGRPRNHASAATGTTSFTVFQVPSAAAMASAAPLPPAGPAANAYDSSSIASTVSSGASFDGMSGFSERGNGANAGAGGVADVFVPMDNAYYTNSARGHRNSFAAMNRVGVPATAPSTQSSDARGGVGWMRTGRIIRVKDTGESFRFPLEDDLLPRITLTPEQYEVLKQRAIKLAEQSINSSHLWMENPTLSPQLKNQSWKVHLEKKNCVIYRQKDNDTKKTAASRNALVRAKLDCTLDELTYALNCDNTDDQRILMAHLYQEGFLDAAVLHVAETATFEDPFQFLGVKWFAFQSSVDSMFSVRDSLVVEFCKTFRDPSGQKILARITQSINMNDYKGVERSFGFARSSSTRVDLFRSLGPGSGKVDASLSSAMQFGSKTTPSWVANRVVSALHNLVININTCADAKYIVKSRLITNKAWVPNNERPACSVCFKSFNLLRSRHHCRVCAEIMCTSCTMELSVLSSKLPPSMRPETGTNMIISSENV
uniref:FYVE-type domain-containing protein n=1 Tax=Globisporangium ultimum (strain ATCC 200006 / CBS 805.95 / DAOM BR144) TaxID=431595 RepID=K3WAH0_GLOUD